MKTFTNSTAVETLLSPHQIWDVASSELRSRLSEGTFAAWFGDCEALSFDGVTLELSVPSPFARDWIENRYRGAAETALISAAGHHVELALTPLSPVPPRAPSPEPQQTRSQPTAAPGHADSRPDHPFQPKYTFDSFVIGSSNRFPYAAALAVAEAPAHAYNPLFIYGGAGLGKTHLLHAMGRYVSECHPDLVVRYVSTEQFINEFLVAVQRRSFPDFHRRYRAADVLLIDDIQFLEGKERTQEEFFHTFNALHPTAQLVITSDRPPKRIATLEERLRTRFEWGLLTDIQPPDFETRLAILQLKSLTEKLPVEPQVLSYIANRIQTNIRELEGALIRVSAYASLTGRPPTAELAHDVLQSILSNAGEAPVTADLVVAVASEYYNVTPDEMRSSSRTRPLVVARQMAMYLCRELTDLSLPKIGREFGNRDHSTVLHATNKIRKSMRERESSYEQVEELTARIRQRVART
ncbi:MAG: chromosomal replication initiator protein DnaA [Actinomycetota bacterium]|nr:chromosomal replication initiator protein DnaA [Actinomycetota bacterium]